MARLARVVVPGYPHHITQRGNRRLPTFFSDADYEAYLALLAEQCAAHGVRIWAWCLMASPLIYSGDITRLDEFTLNVLCNTEVIAVDQDPLGKQARPVVQTSEDLVLAKPMADGSLAVGLFNFAEVAREMTVTWEQLNLAGPQRVRDLWRQKDLDEADGRFSAQVTRHGVVLVRLRPKP
ncbi:MAG: hypothetical protein WBD75_11770 [Phycisphaerae bacterium]